jgi:hypothetical protein
MYDSIAPEPHLLRTGNDCMVGLRDQVPVISIIDDDSVRLSTGRLVRSSTGLSTYTFASAKDFLDSPQLTGTSA